MKTNLLKVKQELLNELGQVALKEKHLKEQIAQVEGILSVLDLQEKQQAERTNKLIEEANQKINQRDNK